MVEQPQKTIVIENTEKRDSLVKFERQYQKRWVDLGCSNQDAPSLAEYPRDSISPKGLREKVPKFFSTLAYPYMNGTLHAGHAFTVSKVEFMTGYARMQGKRALFPLGFHCTGMPIKACADKLVREIEMFGKNFEKYDNASSNTDDQSNNTPAPTQSTTKEDVTKFTAKKGKANAKAVQLKYQFQIMLALGIPKEEISRFADPQYWLHYFPPLCKRDLNSMGARVDWRRSFVTTDANPYYDAFVRWQMNRLKQLGKIKFGKKYTIYSPKDGQACMDHDRSVGEGVAVQEYTALKVKVLKWSETARDIISQTVTGEKNIYFIPATLRPETMYGQTCCFVGPSLSYGIYKVSDVDIYILSDRAARNMSFQGIFSTWGKNEKLGEILGSDVIGTLVEAPLSVHKDGVYILPMETVKANKGTGVVTSVPSDSPDDYATVMELAKKADYYKIRKEWAELEIIPIIKTPAYGDLAARHLVQKLKINSPKDTKLAEAKELAYKEGFYKGTMLYGDYKGKSVEEAKPLVRQQLMDADLAFNYAEPDGIVVSRSGDDCVAAHLDQWYLNYGKEEQGGDGQWQRQVLEYVQGDLNTYSSEAKHGFEQTLDWLHEWACARTYGLGSRLPWDPTYLVESLSDSTIYMSYYTIAHFLHSDIYGKEPGLAGVKPEQMTDDIWDYVFTKRADYPVTDIDITSLDAMRREFEYWYPLDVRVSGKDLIQNHLTFFLYNHLALFPPEYWPKSIRANGHLLLNGEKMSKSTGNFLTLSQAVDKFGADATRIALADAGDGIEDANFEETVANSTILRLFELRKWCDDMIANQVLVKSGDDYAAKRKDARAPDTIQRTGEQGFWDELFLNELYELVTETRKHYDGTMYKLALKSAFYDFTAARDFYRENTKAAGIGMHRDLVQQYIELQALLLCPIAPHWSEYIWLEVLKKPGTIQNETFPTVPSPSSSLTAAREYVRATSSNITSAEGAQQKKMAKGKTTSFDPRKEKRLTIYTSKTFPTWQEKYVDILREAFDGLSIDMKAVSARVSKMGEAKKAMPFVQALKRKVDGSATTSAVSSTGDDEERKKGAANVLNRVLPFDETEVLTAMVPYLKQTLQKCKGIEVILVDSGSEGISNSQDQKQQQQQQQAVQEQVKNDKADTGADSGINGTYVAGNISTGNSAEERRRTNLPSVALSAEPGAPTFFFENV